MTKITLTADKAPWCNTNVFICFYRYYVIFSRNNKKTNLEIPCALLNVNYAIDYCRVRLQAKDAVPR